MKPRITFYEAVFVAAIIAGAVGIVAQLLCYGEIETPFALGASIVSF